MAIYNLYIFNRDGLCIFYKEWMRERHCGMPKLEEDKLLYGMLLSLRSFCERICSKETQQQVRYFKTSAYRLNYMESATGLKFVLNTDPNANGMQELVRSIYQAYVDCVSRNCLVDVTKEIHSELFSSRIDKLISSSSAF